MEKISRRQTLALAMAAKVAHSQPRTPARKTRAESFFGLHFDLHPNEKDTELGKDLSEANINRLLTRVKPDYVQYDCKGHVGWLGYPSQVSKSAPGIVRDSLALWRDLTEKAGVSLYVHFSGVWDSLAISEHPEWARIKPDGKPDDRQTSLWSGYAEERMIPQLLEVSAKYRLDGAWIDGECWQTNPDYSTAALQSWRRLGVGMDAPRKPEDPGWDIWLEFNRQRFRDYVRNYVERLHKERPGFAVASNWLYTTYVPEKPELPVDFISGDYLGNASLTRARLDARYLAKTGKPWDLMAWGFQIASTQPQGHIHKPAVQLMQEAAVVIAQGGGFQIYYQPTRAGHIADKHIDTMAEVARFCRARQALSHKSRSLSEVSLLFSKNSLYRTSGKMFGGWGKPILQCSGMLNALVATHRSVDVCPDWAPLPVGTIVVPEWEEIGDQMATQLMERVRAGQGVWITGVANAKKFAPLGNYRMVGKAAAVPAFVEGRELFAIVSGVWQGIEPGAGKVIAQRYPTYNSLRDGVPAAVLFEIGKGKLLVTPGPIGELYENTHAPALRDFTATCLDALAPAQVRLADHKSPVELVLRAQGDATVLHVLNHVNHQVAANFPAIDLIPSLPAQTVEVRLASRPKQVTWQPEDKPLSFTWSDGVLRFTTPAIELHHMVVIR